MTNPSARPRLFTRIARSLCEWGTMAFATLSIVGLAYWVVSISTSRADSPPLALSWGTVSAKGGLVAISSYLDHDLAVLDGIASYPGNSSAIVDDRAIHLPGFQFRELTYTDGASQWAGEFSLWIVTALSAVVTAVCFAMHRYLRRPTAAKSQGN